MPQNPKSIIVLLTALLSIIGGLAAFSIYPRVSSTIACSGDAFVFSGARTLNTGSYSEIQASISWADGSPNWNDIRYAYFMFDLSSIPSYAIVNDVTLQVYISYVSTLDRADSGYKEAEEGQYYCIIWADTDWDEKTITWNNQPNNGIPGAYHAQLFGGKYGFQGGWFTWKLGAAKNYVMKHLKSDKKVAFVIFPDTLNRQYCCDTSFINIKTKEAGAGFQPKLFISYSIPSYTLTVQVVDSDGVAVANAKILEPFTSTTDQSGRASEAISAGEYTVKVSYQGFTYTQKVTLDSDKTVKITIPKYTLTIKVVDSRNNPVKDATVITPTSGKTDQNGIFVAKLRKGKYTVKVQADTLSASSEVNLDYSKTVTIHLPLYYDLKLKVVDQRGNPLPATLNVNGERKTADKTGIAYFKLPRGSVSIYAEVKVKDKTFSATKTINLYSSKTETIVINRRFYWAFFFNYTDGTVPEKGTITLTSPSETIKVPLVNGVGHAYLLDETYKVVVEASPAVEVGTITVTTDGEFYATLNKEKVQIGEEGAVESTSTTHITTGSEDSPVTSTEPEVPWILIPSIYIYTLIGVLVFGFIIAAIVALRRQR